ncbi:MAG: hypothetical protein ABGX27_06195, partial [Desulfurobacteriaceae bacterium]
VALSNFELKNASINAPIDVKLISSSGGTAFGNFKIYGIYSPYDTNVVLYSTGATQFNNFSIKNSNFDNINLELTSYSTLSYGGLGFSNLDIEGVQTKGNLNILLYNKEGRVAWEDLTIKNSQIGKEFNLDAKGYGLTYENFNLEGTGIQGNANLSFYSSYYLQAVNTNIETSQIAGDLNLLFSDPTIVYGDYATKIGQINVESTASNNLNLNVLSNGDIIFFDDGIDFQYDQIKNSANFVVYTQHDLFIVNDLFNIENTSFATNPNVFLLAGKDVGYGYDSFPSAIEQIFNLANDYPEYASLYYEILEKNIGDEYFTKDNGQLLSFEKNTTGVNFVTWVKGGDVVAPGGIDIKDVNTESKLAFWTQGSLYIGDLTYQGVEPPKGLTIDDAEELCKTTSGLVQQFYCSISGGGATTGSFVVDKWLVD